MDKDLKTRAYVLRRTNYGEADRIINFITPSGKISAFVKGVRKPKSKLAGGVEMFTLSEINLHFGKSDMATLTGAKMIKFHSEILKDLAKMEKASEFLKEINRVSDAVDSAEFFEILDKCLKALNDGADVNLIEVWFLFNIARVSGEQVNLYFDINGNKLEAGQRYRWDNQEMGLMVDTNGPIDANAIKIMRLILTTDFEIINRIKNAKEYVPEILKIAYAVEKVTRP